MAKNVIGYFCGSDSWGGLEMNQLRNAFWMKERGHSVVIFSREEARISDEAKNAGIRVYFIKKHRKYYDVFKASALKRGIKKTGVTHLVVRDPKDMSLCALAKTLSGKSFYLAYFMEMQIGIPKNDVAHTLRFKLFDLWSCPLNWLAQQVREKTNYPEDRIKVIPSGLNLKPFRDLPSRKDACSKLNLDESKKWIGLVGRFDPQKGQHLLLEAFLRIKDQFPEVNVVFLGEKTLGEAEEYYSSLQQFIKAENIEERIEFRPFRSDVETFYTAIDIFVMATPKETFGMVTIEAMAAGLKIVGSEGGGTPEILGRGKFGALFEPENEADLAKKIGEQLKNDSFDPDLIKEEAKKYDSQEVCNQVEAVMLNR